MTTLAAIARRAADAAARAPGGALDAALARHPPPAELAFLVGVIGPRATLDLIEAHGGTRVKLPRGVNQGSALARSIGLDAARALAAWRGGEILKVPLAKVWRIRLYRATGDSYSQIARRLNISETMVHKHLQISGQTVAQPDLFG